MRGADLIAEAEAYASRLQGHLLQIASPGILRGMFQIGRLQPPLGLARIRRSTGELWEPDPTGRLALVIPVCRPAIVEPFDGIEVDTIDCIDLIAFNSREPDRWTWRVGTAWALGEHLIEEVDQSLRLVSTPLGWLRDGGDAACVLDWSDNSPAWRHLRMAEELITDCPDLRNKLVAKIRRSYRLPRVAVEHAA